MPLSFSAAFPSLGKHRPARGFRLLADVALFVAEVSVTLPLSGFVHENSREFLSYIFGCDFPKTWPACYVPDFLKPCCLLSRFCAFCVFLSVPFAVMCSACFFFLGGGGGGVGLGVGWVGGGVGWGVWVNDVQFRGQP